MGAQPESHSRRRPTEAAGAGSMSEDISELFGIMSSMIPSSLLDDEGWQRITDRVEGLPGWETLMQGPGLEFRLGDLEPSADLFVAMEHKSTLLDHYIAVGEDAPAESSAAARGRMCADMIATGESWPTRAILEYDIVEVPDGEHRAPGVFLHTQPPKEPTRHGVPAPATLAAAIAGAAGWLEDEIETAAWERSFAALPPGGEVAWIGAFPGRSPRAIGQLVGGIAHQSVPGYLRGLGWTGAVARVEKLLADFSDVMGGLALSVGITAEGPLLRLGLELYPAVDNADLSPWWVTDASHWRPAVERLERMGLCVPEKAAGLLALPGTDRLYDHRGAFVALRGINHIKVIVNGEDVAAKAYVGMTLAPFDGTV